MIDLFKSCSEGLSKELFEAFKNVLPSDSCNRCKFRFVCNRWKDIKNELGLDEEFGNDIERKTISSDKS